MATSALHKQVLVALTIPLLIGSYLLITSTVTITLDYWSYDIKRLLQLVLLPIIFTVVLVNDGL